MVIGNHSFVLMQLFSLEVTQYVVETLVLVLSIVVIISMNFILQQFDNVNALVANIHPIFTTLFSL